MRRSAAMTDKTDEALNVAYEMAADLHEFRHHG